MGAAQAPGYPVLDFSFNAASNMGSGSSGPGPASTYRYTAVKATANDLEVAPSSSAGTPALGVLQNDPASGTAATVRMLGLSKIVVDGAAGTIVPGDKLGTDASGRGVKVTSGEFFAVALQGSTVQNDIISGFVIPGGRY